jgi:hypothetical protein
MGRAVQRSGHLSELGGDGGDENVGEAAAGVFGGGGGGDLGGKRLLVQPLDDGAEQRFLGLEVVVERLPRQPGGFRGLLDRRAPEAVPAEHQHGSVKNAGARAHLTNFTKEKEMSSRRQVAAASVSLNPHTLSCIAKTREDRRS